eukprot:TRINITY_DN5783_c0_g1_i1.p5 TRINITY_DN5783_c0_g1~~TRINITY_DN5783_c0_g1_i1.p5  ORF type:complete len:55 (-),score=12.73 TRINITY_DN5783_c0_g1_i1:140-304(-)
MSLRDLLKGDEEKEMSQITRVQDPLTDTQNAAKNVQNAAKRIRKEAKKKSVRGQ